MTRQEAIELLVNATYSEEWQGNEQLAKAHHMAIQALEQEPICCKDCKYKVVTDDGEYNPQDIVCSYWASDGLEEEDYCSYGEQIESED